MNRFKYLFNYLSAIATLSLLNACVPVALITPNPKTSIEAVLPESFLNQESEKYFVVPFWKENPFVYYDVHEQKVEIILGDGF